MIVTVAKIILSTDKETIVKGVKTLSGTGLWAGQVQEGGAFVCATGTYKTRPEATAALKARMEALGKELLEEAGRLA